MYYLNCVCFCFVQSRERNRTEKIYMVFRINDNRKSGAHNKIQHKSHKFTHKNALAIVPFLTRSNTRTWQPQLQHLSLSLISNHHVRISQHTRTKKNYKKRKNRNCFLNITIICIARFCVSATLCRRLCAISVCLPCCLRLNVCDLRSSVFSK